MKALVLYSSQTGRTKKIAEAIRSVLPQDTDFLPMEQAPQSFDRYDVVFVGSWFIDNKLDSLSKNILPKLKGKKVALFATMHKDYFSDEVAKNLRQAIDFLPTDVWVAGTYVTQVDRDKAETPLERNERLDVDSAKNFAENAYAKAA